jgi:hypothetical protein
MQPGEVSSIEGLRAYSGVAALHRITVLGSRTNPARAKTSLAAARRAASPGRLISADAPIDRAPRTSGKSAGTRFLHPPTPNPSFFPAMSHRFASVHRAPRRRGLGFAQAGRLPGYKRYRTPPLTFRSQAMPASSDARASTRRPRLARRRRQFGLFLARKSHSARSTPPCSPRPSVGPASAPSPPPQRGRASSSQAVPRRRRAAVASGRTKAPRYPEFVSFEIAPAVAHPAE